MPEAAAGLISAGFPALSGRHIHLESAASFISISGPFNASSPLRDGIDCLLHIHLLCPSPSTRTFWRCSQISVEHHFHFCEREEAMISKQQKFPPLRIFWYAGLI
jgi:hypothetical protein